jgi:aldehyde dehydrogenase (NAD+)
MTYETRLFINNEYVNSSSGKTLSAYNPTDGSLLTDKVQSASSEDVDKAVAAAAAVFKIWKNTTTQQRAATMLKYANLVEKNAEKLAQLETLNMGVPITFSRILVGAQVDAFRYYAGLVDKVHGETYKEDGDDVMKMTVYEPLGVCAGISAWNATAASIGSKIAPAVAMGNTFVHKSSEKDTLGAIFLGSLFKEAGFPPGVVNLLSGAGDVGAALAAHMDIAKITFTGSLVAGRKVQIAAAQSNLKHVSLELGGKSASIVFEDANIANAVQHNSQSFLISNGQICSAASRLFVQESIAPAFIESLKQAWTQVSGAIGNPADKNTFLGPLVDNLHAQSVTDFIDGAKAEGVEVLIGGEKREGPGAFVTPTIFLNPTLDSRIYKEEVFGPVMVIRTFNTEDEVIELANDTPYGLSGAIYSSNISRALKVASRLEVGTLSINEARLPHRQTPWGGYKQSGYGREGGLAGLMEYVQPKAIHINLNA